MLKFYRFEKVRLLCIEKINVYARSYKDARDLAKAEASSGFLLFLVSVE